MDLEQVLLLNECALQYRKVLEHNLERKKNKMKLKKEKRNSRTKILHTK